jgi:hypothetical protein
MSEQLIEGQTANINTLAQELRSMADSLILNGPASFGGCFVVLPPMGGDPIKTLILDSKQDPAQFWAILKTKAEMALAGLDEIARAQGYGMRR